MSKGCKLIKVSIILPTYNRAGLLSETINSILNQTFQNFELIVVDDGSTDNTQQVINRYQENDSRIHYVKLEKNRGVGFARHIGLWLADGELISWADSDDVWLANKLQIQVQILDKHPNVDILFSDYMNFDHIKGTTSNLFTLTSTALNSLNTRQISGDLFIIDDGIEKALLLSSFISIPTVTFRYNIPKEIGSFDVLFRSSEDFEYFFRAAILGRKFAYIKQILMERHKHDSSITYDRLCSWNEKLSALQRCLYWCCKLERSDLIKPLYNAQNRAFRNLIWIYGAKGEYKKVFEVYKNSLKYVFSFRTSFFTFFALFGSKGIGLANKLFLFKKKPIEVND